MNTTGIEWTDKSWNPITGCLHACPYCYAAAISKRFGRSFEPMIHESRLGQPLKFKKPQKIFVCSMADFLGEWVPIEWIDRVLEIAKQAPHHTYQFLTKNPERTQEIDWPSNAWVGASTCTQEQADRATSLAGCNAVVKYISAEPLHEPVRLNGFSPDWVIIGAQTGTRKMQPEQSWVDQLTADARVCKAAVFYKPNLQGFDSMPKEFPNTAP